MSTLEPITTLTFFRYKGLWNKIWAFFMMQFAHKYLSSASGQTFYKLMGSGKGMGFNPLPDWSVYSLLQVWENETFAKEFLHSSDLISKYKDHSSEQWTLYLKSMSVHGKWSGISPFTPSSTLDPKNPLIAVITRARIRSSKLLQFWSYVPTSQKPLNHSRGLIYTKGIGEIPVLNMATFSIWEDIEALKEFAYSTEEHKKAIDKTRRLQWYSEELFSRFQPYKAEGNWKGVDLEIPGSKKYS